MTKTTIHQNETGILIRKGVVTDILSAGVYRTSSIFNENIVVYPLSAQTHVYSFAIRTVEAASVTIDITMEVTIVDAAKLYLGGKTAYDVVYQAIAKQLQVSVESKRLSDLLEGNINLNIDTINVDILDFGLTTSVVLLPRVRLPRNLQNAIDAQEVARQRAKAELEEARGRSAVIRHYANVAKVTKENPDLLRLLLGQKAKAITVAFDASTKASK